MNFHIVNGEVIKVLFDKCNGRFKLLQKCVRLITHKKCFRKVDLELKVKL